MFGVCASPPYCSNVGDRSSTTINSTFGLTVADDMAQSARASTSSRHTGCSILLRDGVVCYCASRAQHRQIPLDFRYLSC